MSESGVKVQLEVLRHKLLDLTLRNRMLNYRPSVRLGLQVLGESSFEVHRMMVEQGKKMSFVGKPDAPRLTRSLNTIHSQADLVALEVHRQAAEEELDAFLDNAAVPVDQLDTKLNVEDLESLLQPKLRTILREAKLANEELGINTLFLTLGILEWTESGERTFKAPLLFVPVSLTPVGQTLKLVHDGSDVGGNLPLRAKLQELNVKLPEYSDDKSLLDYFEEVESSIRNREDWAVHRDEIHLGFFNYEKYAMYMDLAGEQWPEGAKPWNHADVTAMLGGGYTGIESSITDATQLDQVRPPSVAHEVYDADSSQLLAMIRATEGFSIVVEGPPGTGKSQTITNIIAEAVAAGKRVLFVSAKRAALDVVHRRLVEAGLGDMCLDLHDKMTNRREFYSEIKRTADKSLALRDEEAKVARLTELRDKLNAHAKAVNEPLPGFEIPPFLAMSRLGTLPQEKAEDRDGRIPFEVLRGFTDAQIRSFVPAVQALQAKLTQTGVPQRHPFWGSQLEAIDPGLRLDIEEELSASEAALQSAREAVVRAAEALRIDPPEQQKDVAVLKACLEQALAAPPLDGVAVKTDTWVKEEASIREAIALIRRRNEITKARSAQVQSSAFDQDFSSLIPIYENWVPKWYRFISGVFRSARQTLQPHVTVQLAPEEQLQLIRELTERRQISAKIDSLWQMPRLFGVHWKGVDSDPEVLERLLGWVLDLHRKIGANAIPPGLLDLFSGDLHAEELRPLVDDASTKTLQALKTYSSLLALLKMPPVDLSQSAEQQIEQVRRWRSSMSRLTEYIALNEARKSVPIREVVEVADRWPGAATGLTDSFLRSYYTGVLREAMQLRPELRNFDRHLHESEIAEFQKLDDFKLIYNRARVRLAHSKNIPSFDSAVIGSNLHQLNVQCELKTRHKPIRWIMGKAGEAIQRVKPVFMMSPLSVAIHLPPELPPFDLVIFDEASQVRPEDAMSAVIRAKQTIVVGDTRQMPPTSFFDRVADDLEIDEEQSEEAESARETAKLESILSMMSTAVMGRTRRPDLRWHYRSVHPSLIQPSNEMFYDGRLIIFPSPGDVAFGRRIGVVFHHDPTSIYEMGSKKRINHKEADQVAEAVLRHIRENPEMSLMVAAMNKPQADLIYDKVQLLERLHPDLFAAYRQRHPHEPLDVKNLENVQGDERDAVFISITYGRDASGAIRQQFGPLLTDGGERRLNVLITRARQRCEVFSNLSSDDIRIDAPRPGLVALKSYLKFAQLGHLDISIPTGSGEESPFEEEVSAALRMHGYEVATQVGCAEFRIDLAVRDPKNPARFILGVECDGATYHSARSARDRDKLRQRVLEHRGWRIHRIWSHDWWQDRDNEVKRLIGAIESESPKREAEEPTDAIVIEEERPSTSGTRPYSVAPTDAIDDLAKYLVRVVAYEGPVHHELLIIRLRDAVGVAKAGKNIRANLEALILNALAAKRIHMAGDCYYTDQAQIEAPRDWSTRPAAERKIAFIPNIEVQAALKHVIRQSFGIEEEPAIRAAFQLLGFRRISEDAVAKGKEALKTLRQQGLLAEQDNLLRLAG